jgi:hypothetical protein
MKDKTGKKYSTDKGRKSYGGIKNEDSYLFRSGSAVIDSWNLWHEERTFLGSAYAGDYLDNSSNDEYTKAETYNPKSD